VKRLALVLALMATSVLGSCSRLPMLFLLNNTGRNIGIVHASNDGDRTTNELQRENLFYPVVIRTGRGREVTFFQFQPIDVLIRVGRCRAWYVLPTFEGASHNSTIVVQIESDRRLYLLDTRGAYDSRTARVAALPPQPGAFPVAPSDVSGCERPSAGL
jgi:hypothetical protein